MSHANACLTPAGRLRLARSSSSRAGPCGGPPNGGTARSPPRGAGPTATATQGRAGLVDRSSRPACSPRRTPTRVERRVVGLRVSRRWGPARIAYRLGLAALDGAQDPAPLRLPAPGVDRPRHRGPDQVVTHARPTPTSTTPPATWSTSTSRSSAGSPTAAAGDVLGRQAGRQNSGRSAAPGYWYIHNAVDDHSRLAYSEILARRAQGDRRRVLDAGQRLLRRGGITVQRVLTDNGSCYRSQLFAAALGEASHTSGPGPTDPRPTARSNASTAPCSRNGPTPSPTARGRTRRRSSPTGSTPTITTAATPHSAASHQPTSCPTCVDRTASRRPDRRLAGRRLHEQWADRRPRGRHHGTGPDGIRRPSSTTAPTRHARPRRLPPRRRRAHRSRRPTRPRSRRSSRPATTGGNLRLGRERGSTDAYRQYFATYESNGLTISGRINIPRGQGPFPAVVLAHGYVDPADYTNGETMLRERDYLARQGYVTLHIDYRNHAQSDKDPRQRREPPRRLHRRRDQRRARAQAGPGPSTPSRVALIGRSMGGGVVYNALVVRPGLFRAAVAYAPVSSDSVDNFNKWVRRDASRSARRAPSSGGSAPPRPSRPRWAATSPRTYFGRITEPLLIHHGTADEDCPLAWSQESVAALRAKGKAVDLRSLPRRAAHPDLAAVGHLDPAHRGILGGQPQVRPSSRAPLCHKTARIQSSPRPRRANASIWWA